MQDLDDLSAIIGNDKGAQIYLLECDLDRHMAEYLDATSDRERRAIERKAKRKLAKIKRLQSELAGKD